MSAIGWLLTLLVWPAPADAIQVLGWSAWRRRRARARGAADGTEPTSPALGGLLERDRAGVEGAKLA